MRSLRHILGMRISSSSVLELQRRGGSLGVIEDDGIEYTELAQFPQEGNTYILMAEWDNPENWFIRKLIKKDGKDYITKLDTDEEFNMAVVYAFHDLMLSMTPITMKVVKRWVIKKLFGRKASLGDQLKSYLQTCDDGTEVQEGNNAQETEEKDGDRADDPKVEHGDAVVSESDPEVEFGNTAVPESDPAGGYLADGLPV